jgi:SHS2 domain-containing protein
MGETEPEGYRFLEHTSDALIEAWGPNLEVAFAKAAEAFYEIMLNIRNVEPKIEDRVDAEGHDEKELLYDWLEALLLKFDIEGMVYSEFHIDQISNKTRPIRLQAKIKGEKYVREKHGGKVEIKSITYHLMKIQREKNRTRVQFLLDL